MATFSSKTPVSILQEFGVSINCVPSYELIYQSVGTHKPRFMYRVTLGELFADGEGTSKKIAKHVAAQLLLDIIQNREGTHNEELETVTKIMSHPQDNLIGSNFVGDLCAFCVDKQYPEPEYILVQDEGPPHAKIFTMKCVVSHIMEHGTARTKKQAKHTAACNMLQKLKNLSGEDSCAVVVHDSSTVPNSPAKAQRPTADREAEEKFLSLTKMKRMPSSSANIAKQHEAILNLVSRSSTLYDTVVSGQTFSEIEDKVSLLEKISEELGVPLVKKDLSKSYPLYFTKFSIKPMIVCSGTNPQQSMERVLKYFLNYFY